MEEKLMMNGHTVVYDSSIEFTGIKYLKHELDWSQAKVFFDEAYRKGEAAFENHMGTKFKLIHHGSEYHLEKV